MDGDNIIRDHDRAIVRLETTVSRIGTDFKEGMTSLKDVLETLSSKIDKLDGIEPRVTTLEQTHKDADKRRASWGKGAIKFVAQVLAAVTIAAVLMRLGLK